MKEVTQEELRQLQLTELEILKEIVKICEKHDITYSLVFGSLLGNVRHHGFIPWDDDLDMVVPRKEYERLKHHLIEELPEKFFFQDYLTDEEYVSPFAKVRNSETTMIEEGYKNLKNLNHGCWVDIFVADYFDWNRKFTFVKAKEIRIITTLTGLAVTHPNKIVRSILSLLPKKAMLNLRTKKIQKLGKKGDDYVVGVDGRLLATAFEEMIELPFEDIVVKAPADYDNILRTLYFGDYMQFPPKEEQVPKHMAEHFSLTEGYKEYMKNHEI